MFLQKDCFRDPPTKDETPQGEVITDPRKVAEKDEKDRAKAELGNLKQNIEERAKHERLLKDEALVSVEKVIIGKYGFKDRAEFETYITKHPEMAHYIGRGIIASAIHDVFQNHGDLVKNYQKTLHGPHNTLGEDLADLKQKWSSFGTSVKQGFSTVGGDIGEKSVTGKAFSEGSHDALGSLAGAAVVYGTTRFATAIFRHAAHGDAEPKHFFVPFAGGMRAEIFALGLAGQAIGMPVGETVGFAIKGGFKVVEGGAQALTEAIGNIHRPGQALGNLKRKGQFTLEELGAMEVENSIQNGEFFNDQLEQANYLPPKIGNIMKAIIMAEQNDPEGKNKEFLVSDEQIEEVAKYCYLTHKVTLSPSEMENFVGGVLQGRMNESDAERFIYTNSHSLFIKFFMSPKGLRDKFTAAHTRAMNDDQMQKSLLRLADTPNEQGIRDILNPNAIGDEYRADRELIHAEMADLQSKLDNGQKILGIIDPKLDIAGNVFKLWLMAMAIGAVGGKLLKVALNLTSEKSKEEKKVRDDDAKEVASKNLTPLFPDKEQPHLIPKNQIGRMFSTFKKEKDILSPFVLLDAPRKSSFSKSNFPFRSLKLRARTEKGKLEKHARFGAKGIFGYSLSSVDIFTESDFSDEKNRTFENVAEISKGNPSRKALREAFWKDLDTMGGKYKTFADNQRNYFKNRGQLREAANVLKQNDTLDLTINVPESGPDIPGTGKKAITVRVKPGIRRSKLENFVNKLDSGNFMNSTKRFLPTNMREDMVEIKGKVLTEDSDVGPFYLFYNQEGKLSLGTVVTQDVIGSSQGGATKSRVLKIVNVVDSLGISRANQS